MKKILVVIFIVLLLTFGVLLSLYLINTDNTAPPENNEPTDDHIHVFSDWETVEEPSCEKNGTKKQSCICGETKTEVIPQLNHNFIVPSETKQGNSYLFQVLCEYCNKASDYSANGMFLDSENLMYLLDCPQDFTFEVRTSSGIDYLKENISICEAIYRNVDKKKNPDVLENIVIETTSENRYIIKNKNSYGELLKALALLC